MIANLLANPWFQMVGVPIILTIVGSVFAALAEQGTKPVLEHWVVGADLCIEGWAINLGLAIDRANELAASSNGTLEQQTILDTTKFSNSLEILIVVTIEQILLLGLVLYIMKYGHNKPFLRFTLSTLLGNLAIVTAFYNWS